MIKHVWINLPVKDLAKSVFFYEGIGLVRKLGPGNTENSACFAIGEKNVVLMLFAEQAFAGFTNNPLVDCSKGTEVLFSVGVEKRAQIDELAKRPNRPAARSQLDAASTRQRWVAQYLHSEGFPMQRQGVELVAGARR